MRVAGLVVLAGDVDGNKTVENFDLSTVKHDNGDPVTSANFREDVKVDGAINSADVRTVRNDLGHSLP